MSSDNIVIIDPTGTMDIKSGAGVCIGCRKSIENAIVIDGGVWCPDCIRAIQLASRHKFSVDYIFSQRREAVAKETRS